jgi:hypothetical protein
MMNNPELPDRLTYLINNLYIVPLQTYSTYKITDM